MKMPREYHLAQINIARMKASLTDPLMAGFVAQITEINALADQSEGFVWRLGDTYEAGATSIQAFEDSMLLVNMSVWESIEHLQAYVYKSAHAGVMRDRRRWFDHFEGPYMALWWVPASHKPSVEEGKARLAHLREHGESARAFTFRKVYDPPAKREGG